MKDALDAAPAIITSAAQSPLGLLALAVIVLSVLAYLFFGRASERARVAAFVLLVVGAAGLGFALLRGQPVPSTADDPRPSDKAMTKAAPEADPAPRTVSVDLPVETQGDAVQVAARHTFVAGKADPGTVRFRFVKRTGKSPVDVEIQRARDGVKVTTSGHIQANGEWRTQTKPLRELAGERLLIFRWAPGFLNQMGSGGGAAYVMLPNTGDIDLTVTVVN